jgi:hypothetical protein
LKGLQMLRTPPSKAKCQFPIILTVAIVLAATCAQWASAQSTVSPITNADVIQYVKIGLSQQEIINLISEAQSAGRVQFDLRADAVSLLTDHHVSSAIIALMQNPPMVTPPGTEARIASSSRAVTVPTARSSDPGITTRRAAASPPTSAIQGGCSPSAGELQKLAGQSFAEHPGDPETALRFLDVAVGFEPNMSVLDSTVIALDKGLGVLAWFPYQAFRDSLSEAVRKREPISEVPVPTGVTIFVSPGRIDSPDIERIVVERNGQVVAPIANSLRLTEMTSRMGVKRLVHSGEVTFACAAFAPGASVTVTAIPTVGRNYVKVLQSDELRKLK